MSITHIVVGTLWVGVMILGAGQVYSQTYPNKPIRLVAAPVGGGADFVARLIAAGISGPLGQPVIVENRPTILIPEIVAKAPPDGYTLLVSGAGLWIRPLLQNMPYDAVRDFAPITLATSVPDILVVHPSLPVRSVNELIALAKARPGVLNYASSATGSSAHLAGELFKSMAGVNIVLVAYQRANETQIRAVISGEMQLAFVGAGVAAPSLKSGKLKALAVASAQPFSVLPGVPTMAASLPGFESVTALALFAPGKTPATIISRLNQKMVRVLNQADVKEKLFNAGVEIIGNSPEQATAIIKSDIDRMGKVIKEAGIHVE